MRNYRSSSCMSSCFFAFGFFFFDFEIGITAFASAWFSPVGVAPSSSAASSGTTAVPFSFRRLRRFLLSSFASSCSAIPISPFSTLFSWRFFLRRSDRSRLRIIGQRQASKFDKPVTAYRAAASSRLAATSGLAWSSFAAAASVILHKIAKAPVADTTSTIFESGIGSSRL